MKQAQSRRQFKRRQATPTRLSGVGGTDGLVLRVGAAGTSGELALNLARKIVREELSGTWTVQPLGVASRDFGVRRPRGVRNPSAAAAFDLAYRLRRHRDVEDCEPALILPTSGPPEMQSARLNKLSRSSSLGGNGHLSCAEPKQWALDLCRVSAAWALTPTPGGSAQGGDSIVGHPDTGYTDHPEIADPARLLTANGFDFEDGDSDARDTLTGFSAGHGTGTASVIMSGSAPSDGVTGVAPRARLVPLRVTTSVVLLSFDKLAEAIRFAADSDHHVISISLGGPISSRFLRRAVEHAVDRGLIVVCAAGNVWPFVVYPARLDEVIACAACNCAREPWSDSASGSTVDITAPGESVWRASTDGSAFLVGRGNGTSYATGIVAGAAALWLAHHGRANLIRRYGRQNLASVFKEVLIEMGFQRPQGWDTERFGAGILDAERLLRAPLPPSAPAGGLRAAHISAAPRSISQLDEIVELFPDQSPVAVRAALARLLNVTDRQLPAKLRDLGDEVAYLAVTDMNFRQMVEAPPARRGLLAVRAARSGRPIRMSRTLRRETSRAPNTRRRRRPGSAT